MQLKRAQRYKGLGNEWVIDAHKNNAMSKEGETDLPRQQSPYLSIRPKMRYNFKVEKVLDIGYAGEDGRSNGAKQEDP